MAFPAIHRYVFTFQRKLGLIVVKTLHTPDFPEGGFVVTIHAIASKLAFVRIFMASRASICFNAQSVLENGQRRRLHFVTPCAVRLLVLSFQREFGLAVVKFAQSGQRRKGLFVVAFLAVGSEVVVVSIFVATVAIRERYVGKSLERHPVFRFFQVAFDARHCFVFSNQSKIGFVVVKLACRCEGIHGMAFGAIVWKRFLVVIGMAGKAGLFKTQIRFFFLFQIHISHIIRLMALPAVYFFVCARQFVSG